MSAFIVAEEDIDIIVTALKPVTQEVGNELGRKLWAENLRSVAYRYPNDKDGERPGPTNFRDYEVKDYLWSVQERSQEEVMKVVGGCSYQSCEHEGWRTSPAYLMVSALEEAYPKTAALGLPRAQKTLVGQSRSAYVTQEDIPRVIER